MPQKDLRSDIDVKNAFLAAISSDTTTEGAILDTADYDGGVTFAFHCSAYTDGTYTPIIYHGDNAALTDAAAVPDANLIGTEAGAVLTAATVEGAQINTIGIIGTKRYVRVDIVSTSTSTGASVEVIANMKKEIVPVYS